MTEPVAYLVNGVAFNDIDRAKFYSDVLKYHKKIDIDVESLVPIPLYTSEQLHPRVKMTQAEFNEWKNLHYRHILFTTTAMEIDKDAANKEHRYDNIYKRIYNDFGNSETLRNNEAIFAKLYVEFDSNNPEETIEIAPDMKWFVRSKEFQNFYLVVADKFTTEPYVYLGRNELDEAQQFETKEEAELWTNPLTEAVQLPVNGDND